MMIMKLCNSSFLNKSLERAMNSRFAGSKNIALFVTLFLTLSLVAVEKLIKTLFSIGLKSQ